MTACGKPEQESDVCPPESGTLFSSVTQIGLEDTLRRACGHRRSYAPVMEAPVPWNETCHDDWPLLAHRTSLAVSALRTAVILQSRAAPGRRVLIRHGTEDWNPGNRSRPLPRSEAHTFVACLVMRCPRSRSRYPASNPSSSTAPVASDPKGDQSTLIPRASLSAEVAQTGAMWS
jgi:hypothetical protein